MVRKQSFDIMRYWPLIALAISGVVGFIKLQGSVEAGQNKQADTDKRIEKVEDSQSQLYANSVEQKVQTAQMAQKLDLIVDYIKESKKSK